MVRFDNQSERGYLLPVAVIAVGWFLTLGIRFLLPAILPQIKSEFTVGNTTAGLAITLLWAGYGATQFPTGILVDKFGERVILGTSLVLTGSSLVFLSLSPTVTVFLIAVGAIGVVTGLFGTTRGIALSNLVKSNHGHVFGIVLAAGSLGSAVVPFGGSHLAEQVGWRWMTVMVAPLLIIAGATCFVLPRTDRARKEHRAYSWATTLESMRIAVKNRALVSSFVAMSLLLLTFQGFTAFLPIYLIDELGFPVSLANGMFAMLFICGAGFQIAGGIIADRIGTRTTSILLAIVGIFTLLLVPVVTGPIVVGGLIVVLASRIALPVVLNPLMITELPEKHRGQAWGLLRTGFFIIGAFGSTIVGLLVEWRSFPEAFVFLAGVTAIAAYMLTRIPSDSTR